MLDPRARFGIAKKMERIPTRNDNSFCQEVTLLGLVLAQIMNAKPEAQFFFDCIGDNLQLSTVHKILFA